MLHVFAGINAEGDEAAGPASDDSQHTKDEPGLHPHFVLGLRHYSVLAMGAQHLSRAISGMRLNHHHMVHGLYHLMLRLLLRLLLKLRLKLRLLLKLRIHLHLRLLVWCSLNLGRSCLV